MATELTAEQKTALGAENERQAAQSYRFLGRNPRYKNTPENNQKLMEYITAQGLSWDVETLEDALSEIGSQMLMTDEEVQIKAASKPSVEPPAKISEFPWPTPLTAVVVRDMSREDYKRFVKDTRFVEQVAALGIRRG
jgi:hypothetical protein